MSTLLHKRKAPIEDFLMTVLCGLDCSQCLCRVSTKELLKTVLRLYSSRNKQGVFHQVL